MHTSTRSLSILTLILAGFGGGCRDSTAQAQAPAPRVAESTTGSPLREVGQAGPSRMTASPLVSSGKRTEGSSPKHFAKTKAAVDGDKTTSWNAGSPTADQPAWIAIDIGKGPSRLLLRWSAAGSFNYEETDYGSPGAYRIEVSADSTNGENGTWREVASVPHVTTHGEAHRFAFEGQRWVKMVITAAPALSPNGVQIDEIAVHDATGDAMDTWFFAGDSITAFAMGRTAEEASGFAAKVHARHPGHYPLVLNGGMGGEKSDEGAKRIGDSLAKNPDAHFWAIGYGTNDAAGDSADTTRFKQNLLQIVDAVRAAGRAPILATIPFAPEGHKNIPRFNAAIEEVRQARELPAGPDLYKWFESHPDELADGLHPNEKGIASVNRLWAEAVEPLYARRLPPIRGRSGVPV